MTKKRFSVLHIEDDSLWQGALAQALRGLPNIANVVSVTTGQEGLAALPTARPDIVLLDAVLPDCDGLGLIEKIAAASPQTSVVLLSARCDEFILFAATQPNVSGLLWKGEGVFQQLDAALRAVVAGEKYFSPEVREALRRFRADPNAFFKMLSPREIAILSRIGRGESDGEIATALSLSAHTVQSHRHRIMRKLDLPNSARLIHWAITRGFAGRTSAGWTCEEGRA